MKTFKLQHQLTQTDIVVCYGKKSYAKAMKHLTGETHKLLDPGVMTTTRMNDSGKLGIVIGLQKRTDIYALKGTLVHELSHAVSAIMEEHGMVDDEVRSYMLQWMYMETVQELDEWLSANV